MELSLQSFALNGDLTEGFAEEVLRTVATSMATVTADRKHQPLVFSVVGEQATEAIGDLHKVIVLRDFGLQKARLHVYLLKGISREATNSAVSHCRLNEVVSERELPGLWCADRSPEGIVPHGLGLPRSLHSKLIKGLC